MERSVAGILLKGPKIFTAKRPAGGALGGRWEFPGGKAEPGETDQQALQREFLEEFGARIRALRLLGEATFLHRGVERILAAWLAELESDEALVPTEHVQLRWSMISELEALDLADSDRKLLPYLQDLA